MNNAVLILTQTGAVNQVFGVLPDNLKKANNTTTKEEYNELREKNKKSILDYLRYDNDKYETNIKDRNPTRNSNEIDFRYSPVFYRQDIASQLPYQLTNTITVIDAFACMGQRFKLKRLVVFVEVYKSSCGYNRIWANIFYATDSEIPICTITVERYITKEI